MEGFCFGGERQGLKRLVTSYVHRDDANCRAEILLVNGDHRVGIYAGRDIPSGSELFYNYHYDRLLSPPEWVKKPPKLAGNNFVVTAKFGS